MITLVPIGYAYNNRAEIEDDYWGGIVSKICDTLPEESLYEIESFSHLEIIYYFHKVSEEKIIIGANIFTYILVERVFFL